LDCIICDISEHESRVMTIIANTATRQNLKQLFSSDIIIC
jgi:hypothetical protein